MNEQLSRLSQEVAKILNVEAVDVDLGLGEIGVDSLNIVELIIACENVYAGQIDASLLNIDQYTSLRSLDEQLNGAVVA